MTSRYLLKPFTLPTAAPSPYPQQPLMYAVYYRNEDGSETAAEPKPLELPGGFSIPGAQQYLTRELAESAKWRKQAEHADSIYVVDELAYRLVFNTIHRVFTRELGIKGPVQNVRPIFNSDVQWSVYNSEGVGEISLPDF